MRAELRSGFRLMAAAGGWNTPGARLASSSSPMAGAPDTSRSGTGSTRVSLTSPSCSLTRSQSIRVVDHVDAPDGGSHIWFMRWDP